MSHLIYIGAGSSRGLEHWLEYGSMHSVLLEPHPQRAERLRQQTAGSPSVTVAEAAVAARPNSHQGKLLAYTLPHASGLHEPKGLWPLFPGLRLLERYPVNVISAHQLVADYFPSDEDAEITLVLHAPGEEHAILQTLMENDQLSRVARLHLSAFTTPVNVETPAVKQTLKDLQDYGFDLIKHEDQDPDWQLWTLQLSDIKRQLISERQDFSRQRAEQEKQAASLKQELAAAQQALTEAQQAKAAAEKAAAEKLQAAKTERTELNTRLDSQANELKLAKESQTNFKQERDALQQKHTQSQEKLEQTHGWFLKRKQQAEAQAEQLKALQAECDTLAAKNAKFKEVNDSLKQERDEQTKAREAAQAESANLKGLAEERITQLSDARQEVSRLKTENQQLVQRQHAIQEEMVKTEAQLDLIKEWVLPESSL